tara:strand:+ start:596 stop:1345 length:750 start_codon:yes stop_codon:yes gene_type:complete
LKYIIKIILLTSVLFGQSGYDIAEMVFNRPAPSDMINKIKMTLTNSKGKTRESIMQSKSMDNNKKQIIWFLEPKDDRGVSFLKIERDGLNDDMRMWLPAFKRTRRISAKRKGDAFMGSDLSFEDLSNRELSDYQYRRLDDEEWKNIDCYVLEIFPKKETRSNYEKHFSWISKSDFIILKEHSFNKKGELAKQKEFFYHRIGTFNILNQVNIKNLINKHGTKVVFSDIEINSGLDKNLFHERNLKRIPNH